MATSEMILLGVSAIGGMSGFAAVANVYMQRNKTKAEERKLGIDGDVSISGTALEMYKLARAEAQEAKLQSTYCQEKVDALEDHVDVLRSVMRQHSVDPPPFQFPGFIAWREARA